MSSTTILIIIASLTGAVTGNTVHHINFYNKEACYQALEVLKSEGIKSYCVDKKVVDK